MDTNPILSDESKSRCGQKSFEISHSLPQASQRKPDSPQEERHRLSAVSTAVQSAARAAGRLTKPEVLPNFELPTNVYTMFCLGQKSSDKKCVGAELLPAPSFLGGENQLVNRIVANHPNARESKVLQLLFQLKRIVLSIFAPRFRDLEGPPPEWRQLQEAARINI